MAQRLGLEYVWLKNDDRKGFRLDHVLVRGLIVKSAELLHQSGSDHRPIYAELQLYR